MNQHLSVKNPFAKCLLSCAVLLLPTLLADTVATAQVTTNVIALTGDTAPDGMGTFSDFGRTAAPSLNDAGQAAFLGYLATTSGGIIDSNGLFLGDGKSSLVQIVRSGQAAPDGNGSFSSSFYHVGPTLNNAGQVAFYGILTRTDGHDGGIFRGNDKSGPVQIARAGDTAPDGNGTFSFFAEPSTLNESGQVVFHGVFTGTTGGFSDDRGIYIGDGTSSLLKIVRAGDPAPNGNGRFDYFGANGLALNDAGRVAFQGVLTHASGGANGGFGGIFHGDGTSSPIRIVRAGQIAPDGNGIFSGGDILSLNNAGQVSFIGSITETSGGINDGRGIFLGNGESSIASIVREGDSAPDGNGSFLDFRNRLIFLYQ